MSEPIKGRLEYKKDKLLVFWQSKRGEANVPIPPGQLDASLASKKPQECHGMEVHLELENGRPIRIRPVGAQWQASSQPQPASSGRGSQQRSSKAGRGGQSRQRQQQGASRGSGSVSPGDDLFYNPYNFIPAPPRKVDDSDLGDKRYVSHDRYHADRWSGRLRVTLKTKTPLLIPDLPLDPDADHKAYPVRLGIDGKPYLSPTSVKGMLRSAYEAVTNSRMSVFVDHEDRLGYRLGTDAGSRMVPARIENGRIRLLPGTSRIGDDGAPRGRNSNERGVMYAAWLGAYAPLRENERHLRNLSHGSRIWFQYETYTHRRNFRYHLVTRTSTTEQPGWTMGYVFISNLNADGKKRERIFFIDPNNDSTNLTHGITSNILNAWEALIKNYQEIHKDEIEVRRWRKPSAISNSDAVWSRHIARVIGNSVALSGESEWRLEEGTLCYARVRKGPKGLEVLGLYPVQISRDVYQTAPEDLLDPSLRPATSPDQLSPADRVFGWVNQEGSGAYRGNLRIGPVKCISDNPVESFGNNGFPLAILAQPKPAQARFYLAKNKNGEAQDDGNSKEEAGYKSGKGLRGRKVYPHHRGLPDNHWSNPVEDRTQNPNDGHFQEYRRPRKDRQEQRDDQNRSILSWVKPGTEFTFDIFVTNLSAVELGALLWLLELPEGHFHRLGGGKPLGFGSVRLLIDWDNTDLREGKQWKEFFRSLTSAQSGDITAAQGTVEDFKNAVVRAYATGSTSFDNVEFIKAFLRCAEGFRGNHSICYPRVRRGNAPGAVPPHPDGESFKWFEANERGEKRSLPNLTDDCALPFYQGR